MTVDVTILIPVWNRADLLRKLLDTISTQTYLPKEVVVIDNGSTDDAPLIAESWGARLITMGENRGFAAAANRGIEQSITKWVALINSDVELRPDWLQQLLLAATETNAWFATGKILSASNPSRIDGTWDLVAKSGCAWRAGFGREDAAVFSTRRIIAMSSATAVLYRRDLFTCAGNFAEVYESYLEDVDLSLRCAAACLAGVYEPAAICVHQGSASSGRWSAKSTYLNARNQELLRHRLFSPAMRKEWWWKITVGRVLWALVALRHGQFRSWLEGMTDGRRSAMHAAPISLHDLKLRQAIVRLEKDIFTLQHQTGIDFYWRLYFLLTGVGSE